MISLDTGSPISTICFQYLVSLTHEPRTILLNKLSNAASFGNVKSFGVYGSQDHHVSRVFTPYLLENIKFSDQLIKYFLVWVDVTDLTFKSVTSTLFGFDYIKQGKKWFDEEDNFHIKFDDNFSLDLQGLKGALHNHADTINTIDEIKQLKSNGSKKGHHCLRNLDMF